MEEQTIFQANRESTDRMRKIIGHISEDDFVQRTGNDWTIAITLAHVALWDQRVIFVIESARKNNKLHAPFYDEQLNDILTPLLAAIPAQEAIRLAISTAERVDIEIEECPKELLAEMKEVNIRLLDRSIHRNLHLDEIENTIMRKY
jgi:hypothetical protein